MIKRALTVVVSLAALLAVAAPAEGQQYPPAGNFIVVSDSTVVAGQVIVIQAGTFAPGSTVTLNFFSDPVALGSATGDALGIATLSARIPGNARAGDHTITATGVDDDGTALELSTTVTVLAADDGVVAGPGIRAPGAVSGGLPRTGSESLPLTRIAAALLAVGGGLLFMTRRRRAAAVT